MKVMGTGIPDRLNKAGIDEKLPSSRYVSAFFGSLMQECMYPYLFDNNEQRKEAVENWLDYYNNERIHRLSPGRNNGWLR